MHDQVGLEKNILGFWEKKQVYQKAKQQAKDREKFYFCDGPPYATGQIHPGTAWNKCIKDAVCRFKRSSGFNVRAQPGFDTHGLPIEVKVEQQLKLGSKKEIEVLGISKFISKCKSFATQHIDVMSGQFRRIGVWMDFERPYITYEDKFIESSWRTIKVAHEKGLLQRGVSVLPYCSRCETTIANYELEYGEQKDPSIYVKFKLSQSGEFLVIWTTTPWTLISNMAVMVHPTFTYVRVKVGSETWVVAKERLDAVMAFEFGKSPVVLGEMSGKRLEGLEYDHPLEGKIGKSARRKVVLSDEYVTLEDGSGLVHCAPGHGPEDFIIGKRFGIEIYSPIDTSGKFKLEAGDYAGLRALEANKTVIEDLHQCGALIHSGSIMHRYPHCWRCKTPLIFMTTDQWFISITKLKQKMLEEIENISWTPDFAKTRFSDFVSGAPDWCISRQRYWGIPLPIWVCQSDACKEIRVLGDSSGLPKLKELHRPYIDEVTLVCKCGGKMSRVPDILDVWFDSGNAIWASLTKEEEMNYFPSDFIVEGKDQTRGWFYSLLGSGMVLCGSSPYKSVMMHGFFVDEKGEKMSKSVGNFVPLEEIVDKYGSDTFRLWSLSNTVWDDLKFNWDEVKEASRVLNTYFNMLVFLQRFHQHKPVALEQAELEVEDRWILSRLNSLVRICNESLNGYEVHKASKAIRQFIVEDLSRTYLKLAKRRIMQEENAKAALCAIYHSMLTLSKLAAPIIPFISEHVYREFFMAYEKEESVSLFPYPQPNLKLIDAQLERKFEIASQIVVCAASCRQAANVKLRWPLESVHIVSSSTQVNDAAMHMSGIIETMANVQKVAIGAGGIKSGYSLKVHHSKIGAAFKEQSGNAIKVASNLDANEVAASYGKEGKHNAGGFEFTPQLVEIIESATNHAIGNFEDGKIYLKVHLNKELFALAMVREVSRRIQISRKESGMVESDMAQVGIECDKELESILKAHESQLCAQVSAKSVDFGQAGKGAKEWEIEDFKAKISVKKAK
ncbi:isoleucine--tRNA ligase [Candidatus Parvarchaeota archaeon]|nr:isoleucine--tRNA ligase [Candidatus Parvarchaeota archaeon]